MTLPKNSSNIDKNTISITKDFLVEKYELSVDRKLCIGCGQCSIVCPQDAIVFNAPTSIEPRLKTDLCVYCGTCNYFCPTEAMTLKINAEKVELEDLKINLARTLPKLENKLVHCDKFNVDAKVYWEGITVIDEEQRKEPESKCGTECLICKNKCPTGAIFVENEYMQINDDICFHCGACSLACPEDLITTTWVDIKTSGRFNNIFWKPIKEKLIAQKVLLEKMF